MLMATNSVECPVNFVSVNGNIVRIIALQVFMISALYVITSWAPLIIFLLADFFARGFGFYKFSILAHVSTWMVRLLHLRNKPIDQAPKLFAARLGIVLSLLILIFHSGFPVIAMSFAVLFSLFSFLESALGFCAGCYLYNMGKKVSWI